MSLTVGELQVLLSGDTRKLNRDLDQLDSRAGKTEQVHTAAWKRVAVTAGAAIAAIGIGAFVKDTANLGIQYTGALNNVQAVTGATAETMSRVRDVSRKLGSDLTLPATSAYDAAQAMEELSKGGLNVEQAMQAAKGSLQLSAAAQISAAEAAQIQSAALNQFNLSADQAGRVADVLAATANAAAGELTDVALALSYVGPVANAMGIEIESAAGAIGVLANNGILGEKAGTSLRAILASLSAPSKLAAGALEELGVQAFDAQGNFVGFNSVAGQLSDAQGRLTTEAFASAAAIAFGNESLASVNALAKEGAGGLDAMTAAAHRQGAATDLAAARTKGLGGAIDGLKSQFETFQIDLYERASPNIEKLVRYASEHLPEIGNAVLDGVDDGIAALGRLKDGAVTAFEAIAKYVSPVTDELDDLWASLTATHGPAQATWGALKAGGTVLVDLAKAAQPVVRLGGQMLKLFNSLPGPVQTAVLALGALKIATSFDFFGKLAGSEGKVRSSLGGAGQSVAGFAQTVRMNMRLAGDEVGGLTKVTGGLSAGFQTYLPNASRQVQNFGASVGSAFEQAKQLQRFKVADMFGTDALRKGTGDVAGFNAALKDVAKQGVGGLRSAAGGLVGFLGGPWGATLAGAGIAVGLWQSAMQRSEAVQDSWAESLRKGGRAAAETRVLLDRLAESGSALAAVGEETGHSGLAGFIDGIPGLGRAIRAMSPDVDEATAATGRYWRSLEPVEQAQAKVSEWTNTLSYRLARYGERSEMTTTAQDRLAFWTGEVARRQGELDSATTSATGALQAQTAAALAGANADLAASQANTQLATAEEQYNQSLADGTLTTTQHQQATDAMTAAAYGAAAAAAAQAKEHSTAATEEGKQAEADAALLASLKTTAQQLGANTPAAISNLIASLEKSTGTASTTSAQMRDLGIQVTSIPGSKDIIVRAPTEDQKKRLADLGYTVTNIPGSKDVTVHANTDAAEAALSSFVNRPRTAVVQVVTRGGDIRVSGGNGPGGTQVKNARGNIVHAYAGGGFEPMRGGIAQVVPPNTWRVIGDRVRDDEAYIPINRDRRSLEILALTAKRMGGQFVPGRSVGKAMAAGTGSASVGGVTKVYNLNAAVTQTITLPEFMRLQKEAEALYG